MTLRVSCALIVLTATGAAPRAAAFVSTNQVGELTLTLYAPDWTWQGQYVNMLVVVHNPSGNAQTIEIELDIPDNTARHFEFAGERIVTLELSPVATQRFAYTDIHARSGMDRGEFPFTLRARTARGIVGSRFLVRTVRGQAAGSGQAAALLPAAVAAVWCVVMVAAFRRYGAAGAWRSPGEPIAQPAKSEAWIAAQP